MTTRCWFFAMRAIGPDTALVPDVVFAEGRERLSSRTTACPGSTEAWRAKAIITVRIISYVPRAPSRARRLVVVGCPFCRAPPSPWRAPGSLHHALLEIELEWNEGESLPLHGSNQTTDFPAVEQQFPAPGGLVVDVAALVIWLDMGV